MNNVFENYKSLDNSVAINQARVLDLFAVNCTELELSLDGESYIWMSDDLMTHIELTFGINGLNLPAVFCTISIVDTDWSLSSTLEDWEENFSESLPNILTGEDLY